MKRVTVGAVICVVLIGILSMSGIRGVPFRSNRQLPIIHCKEISKIEFEHYMGDRTVIDCTHRKKELVAWYNDCKEVKTEVGTTSDARITLSLDDDSRIYIWNLYSEEWVTIGYRKEGHYYQSNVRSVPLATFIKEMKAAIHEEQV